jgi:hypothetical protein
MNLLTNGFVNNCGRLFEPSEQFEGDIVELGLMGFSVMNGRAIRYRRRFRADNGPFSGTRPRKDPLYFKQITRMESKEWRKDGAQGV